MIITNKFNVPDVIWRAASTDRYSRGLADISITQLIDAPQVSILKARYKDLLEQDVTDKLWSLLGTAVHGLLEAAEENHIVEERLFVKAGGLTISGAIDVQEDLGDSIGVMDFKCCSVTAVQYGKKAWHEQLNCYAYLIRKNKGKRVSKLQICAICRDWKRADLIRSKDYPKSPIVVVDIPVWPDDVQERYVEERANLHREAREGADIPCSKDERWERGEKWAVLKSLKSKRATRTFVSEQEAIDFAASSGYIVEHRPGTCARCEQDYCQVARWCEQWKKIKDDKPNRIAADQLPTEDGWL